MDAVRAMTWNTWWRFGGNWREREPGLVRVVHDVAPDLLGLQECWGLPDETQADRLAAAIGGHAAFVEVGLPPAPSPSEYADQEGVAMGLGLVSRWPIGTVEACPMPSDGRHLVALRALVERPGGAVHVVVGATSWEPERADESAAQIAELERLTLEVAGEAPAILLADLNYDFRLSRATGHDAH